MHGLIDWELLDRLTTSPAMSQPAMWEAFADRYNGYVALQADYTRLQIDMFGLSRDETVLDVGAGPGRLTVPAAGIARSVTALDVSSTMLAHLERNAQAAGRNNVRPLNLAWDDVVPGENLDMHDVVIAARSPAMRDLGKIDLLARKRVYISLFAGESLKSFHDSLLAGIEPDPPPAAARPSPMPGYALVFNRLTAMGIEANVRFIPDGFSRTFADRQAILDHFSWLSIAPEHEKRFLKNIGRYVYERDDGLELRMETRTVVLWWEKTRGSPFRSAAR